MTDTLEDDEICKCGEPVARVELALTTSEAFDIGSTVGVTDVPHDTERFWALSGFHDRMHGRRHEQLGITDAAQWGLDAADFGEEADPEAAYERALTAWRAGWLVADSLIAHAGRG